MDIPPNIVGPLITAGATLIGIVVSAFLVLWQFDRQNKNLLKLQEKKIKDDLNLKIYLEIEEFLKIAASSLGKAVTEVNNVPSALSNYLFQKNELGLSPALIKERTDTLLNGHQQALIDLTNITYAIERYEIALPKITILQLAFFEKQFECSDKFFNFFNKSLNFLPIDIPDNHKSTLAGKTLATQSATSSDIEKLKVLAQVHADCAEEIQAYIYDLRIILQNSLLSHIFDRKLSGRRKANPNLIILKTDDSEDMKKLKSDLLRSGKWGKVLAKTWSGFNSE